MFNIFSKRGYYHFICKEIPICLILLMVFFRASDAGEPCPEKVQAVLLVKILSYTKEIGGKENKNPTIGVLNGGSILKDLQSAVAKSGTKMIAKEVTINDLKGIDVLYIPEKTKGDLVKQAKTAALNKKIFTVAGSSKLLEDFGLTLTFYVADNKPKILINRSSGDAEGINFSAKLLKIADLK